jgi:hypothetical protein
MVKIDKKVIKILFVLLVVVYIFALVSEFSSTDFNKSFQYDAQILWQSLEQFSKGKIVFKDFLHGYGNLFMLFGLPFYLLGGKTLRALMLVRKTFLAGFGVIFSFISGFLLLKLPFMVLYGFLLLIYQTNWHFASLRHIIPEMGLIFGLAGILIGEVKLLILSGLTIGASFGLTFDYPLFASLALLILIGLSWFGLKKEVKRQHLLILFLSFILGILGYATFAYSNGLLMNKIKYTRSITNDFYAYAPCRSVYPRFEKETDYQPPLSQITKSIFPISSVKWLLELPEPRRANLYFVPFVIAACFFYVLFSRLKNKKKIVLITMLIYSTFAYYRTLNSPALIKFTFGLNLFFLVLAYLLQKTKDKIAKVFLGITIIWFMLTPKDGLLSFFEFNKPNKNQVNISGVYVSKELGSQYKKISELIKLKTTPDEKIFVYPFGPYYQLADRDSPVFITGGWQMGIAPHLVDRTYQELESNPPELIIINRKEDSISTNIKGIRMEPHALENNRVVIEGAESKVEDFIEDNYAILAKYPIAYVLEKAEKFDMPDAYQPVNSNVQWEISQDGDDYMLKYDYLPEYDLAKVMVKADLPFFKILSKFVVSVYGIDSQGEEAFLGAQFASGEKQEIYIYPEQEYDHLKVELSENYGFIWWGKPKFKVGQPKLFKLNPQISTNKN